MICELFKYYILYNKNKKPQLKKLDIFILPIKNLNKYNFKNYDIC